MSNCYICNNEIPRGQRYKGEKYKNISVCSEECYNVLLEQKAKATRAEPYEGYNNLISYINAQWAGNINWMLTAKQIKALVKNHDFSCKEIRAILKYAIEIEGECVDLQYGITQFIPKYTEPCRQFLGQIKKAKELAESMKEEEIVYRKSNKQNKKIKLEEWD